MTHSVIRSQTHSDREGNNPARFQSESVMIIAEIIGHAIIHMLGPGYWPQMTRSNS